MFCTNCGTPNKDVAKFCIHCGEFLSEVQREGKGYRVRVLSDGSFLKKAGFLKVFYDFSFNQLTSQKMIRFLYGLSILFAGLSAILLVFAGFKNSLLFGFILLFIGAPLIFLLIVIYSRAVLEMIFAISRITDRMANMGMTSNGMTAGEEKPESRDDIQWNI
jgi:hypothetical protein